MDKTDIPESFGVFKPVGHTVIAFRSEGDMQAAVDALLVQGFASSACTRYSPEEMMAQVDVELRRASPLAAFGHELKLIEAHGALAQSGCSFLVVHAPDEAQADRVAAVAKTFHAAAAQRYDRWSIEDLIEPAVAPPQAVDLPAR